MDLNPGPLASQSSTIAIQGHSRSFILQSITNWQRISYRHVIMLSRSPKFTKK